MPISAVTSEVLLEVKTGQWRAGIWIGDGACWVIAVGHAKGDHKDRDDFYQRLERLEASGGIPTLLPTSEDRALRQRESADALLTAWQHKNQVQLIEALAAVAHGGTARAEISSPDPTVAGGALFATVELEVGIFREPDYWFEDVVVTFDVAERWKGSRLGWLLTMQTLAAISPPEQGWDIVGDSASNLLEIGTLPRRVEALGRLAEPGEIATTKPGHSAHYAHQKNLAEHSVEGTAVRALCGVYFVPRQDAMSLVTCPTCDALRAEIPRG